MSCTERRPVVERPRLPRRLSLWLRRADDEPVFAPPSWQARHSAGPRDVCPPDIASKAARCAEQGLTRLYGFQHGGWRLGLVGERRDQRRHVGLRRLRAWPAAARPHWSSMPLFCSGGCDFLRQRLERRQHVPCLTARAWHALALAGQTDNKHLDKWARNKHSSRSTAGRPAWVTFGPRLPGANLNELGERLWSSLKDWEPESILRTSASELNCADRALIYVGRLPAQRPTVAGPAEWAGYWEAYQRPRRRPSSLGRDAALCAAASGWFAGWASLAERQIGAPYQRSCGAESCSSITCISPPGSCRAGENHRPAPGADASEPVHFALSASGTQAHGQAAGRPATGSR